VVSVPLGGMMGAMIAQRAIPSFGWRAIFWIGTALPLLFIMFAAWLLPESPRYLAQDPVHSNRLAVMLNRLLREPRFAGSERF
jgi:AAHS family 4-hydroxybenzoate transporter-like MFS transporter